MRSIAKTNPESAEGAKGVRTRDRDLIDGNTGDVVPVENDANG